MSLKYEPASVTTTQRFSGFAEILQELVVGVVRLRYNSQFENNYFTEMCSGSEEGSYLRLIDWCITQL